MKRNLLLTALFCSLLTVWAQTDNVRRNKSQTPAKTQAAPSRKPTPAKPAPTKTSKPVSPTPSKRPNHDYVNLGLPSGTLWATCNVGASKPEEYGDLFAWGETKAKKWYDWSTYFDTNDDGQSFMKYHHNYGGTTELEPSDDAASVNWGSDWRMPSQTQIRELLEKCIWTWTSKNGVKGFLVESKFDDNSIFLPATGNRIAGDLRNPGFDCTYWSRSLYRGDVHTGAWFLLARPNNMGWSNANNRYYGCAVRPVRAE